MSLYSRARSVSSGLDCAAQSEVNQSDELSRPLQRRPQMHGQRERKARSGTDTAEERQRTAGDTTGKRRHDWTAGSAAAEL